MPDDHELYELTGDLPELDRPVLVQAMTGFVDAGGATRLARDQLLAADDTELLVRFDIDALLDYRSRRPTMQFVEDHWESYEEPQLAIFRAADEQGTQFLLLTGPEPDLAWERFTAAVIDLVERLNVRLTVGFNAIPMAVPHTRPTGVTAHASKRELIAGYEPWLQRVQVPGSAGHLLEYRLGQQGHDAMGFAVHVPHYLAQTEFPQAAEQLHHIAVADDRPAAVDGRAAHDRSRGPGRGRPPDRREPGGGRAGRVAGDAVRHVSARSRDRRQPARHERSTADRRGAGCRAGTLPGQPDQPAGRPAQSVVRATA